MKGIMSLQKINQLNKTTKQYFSASRDYIFSFTQEKHFKKLRSGQLPKDSIFKKVTGVLTAIC